MDRLFARTIELRKASTTHGMYLCATFFCARFSVRPWRPLSDAMFLFYFFCLPAVCVAALGMYLCATLVHARFSVRLCHPLSNAMIPLFFLLPCYLCCCPTYRPNQEVDNRTKEKIRENPKHQGAYVFVCHICACTFLGSSLVSLFACNHVSVFFVSFSLFSFVML